MAGKIVVTPSRQLLPKIAYCAERQKLLDAFCDATEQLTMLQDQQVAAVISADGDFTGFDLLIRLAHEKKSQAKNAYICHVEHHGC